ncbi:uncharacterized protein [Oscarella lobularis]|uniref:uncharacterized protein n=1 Tax=Oscarella lobularis TaxID=121494 RepID=UPI003314442B
MVSSCLLSSVPLCMAMLLLKPSVLFAALEFIDDPSKAFRGGYVYIPPDGHGDLIVVCTTNERSTIAWLSGGVVVPAILNVTQTTDRKSVLYAKGVGNGGANFAVRSALLGPSFTCEALSYDQRETARSGTFRFALGVVPKLAFRPLPYVTAIEGEMVNFTCAYNTSIQPLPHLIRWNRGSGASQSLANFRFYSTLSIQANRSNAGEYQCTTSNIFGIAVATTTLIVNYSPTLLYAVSNYRFQVGAPFTVLLSVDAQPPANVILIKGTSVINSTSQSNVLYYTEAKARKAMAGIYFVMAINNVGTYRETFNITIDDEAGSESPSPTWTKEAPEDKSFSAGIITAIVVPATLVAIVLLVSLIYFCVYRNKKVESIKTDAKEFPVYADVSRPKENIQMKPSHLYETRKMIHMTSNSGYETTASQ